METKNTSKIDICKKYKEGSLHLNDHLNKDLKKVAFTMRISRDIVMDVFYLKDKDDLDGIEIVKINKSNNNEPDRMLFSKFNFQQLKEFLNFINTIDLKGISKNIMKIEDGSLDSIDEETRKKIITILSTSQGDDLLDTSFINKDILKVMDLLIKYSKNNHINIIKELLENSDFQNSNITNEDIVNTGYRKKQLSIFKDLLEDNSGENLKEYKIIIKKPDTKDETAWQQFFDQNPWIFGYGLDYRIMGILQKEALISTPDISKKNYEIIDFLLADKKFITFVETKLPTTPLFGKSTNRKNCWKLSNELIDAVSQILEYKASGLVKFNVNSCEYSTDGNEIEQKAYDSKTILVIGNWNELDKDKDNDNVKNNNN